MTERFSHPAAEEKYPWLRELLDTYHTLGREIFGEGWEYSDFYRSREWFKAREPSVRPSYAGFSWSYGSALCVLHFGKRVCPVSFGGRPPE